MAEKLELRPITLRAANAFVAEHHRHNKPARGCKFCLAAFADGVLEGIAIVSRPVARGLDDGLTAEVVRLCVRDGAPRNTCSFLYGAARRAWFVMGGKRLVTYTLEREGGASLRGAGWQDKARLPARDPKDWVNRGNGRVEQAVVAEDKVRWETVNG